MVMQKQNGFAPLAWIRAHRLVSFLVFLAFVAIGIIAYQKFAVYQNKRNFQQARQAIDAVYADVVRQVGEPDNHKSTDSCSRSYQEFTGYGQVTCNVSTDFIYGVVDQNIANTKLHKIQNIITEKNEIKLSQPLASAISSSLVIDKEYSDAQDYYNMGKLKCTAKYVYNTPSETYLTIPHSVLNTFYVTTGCYGPAKGIFYPLAH